MLQRAGGATLHAELLQHPPTAQVEWANLVEGVQAQRLAYSFTLICLYKHDIAGLLVRATV